jgi:hypothetical protein
MVSAPARLGCGSGDRGRRGPVARSCQTAATQAGADTHERPRQAMIPRPGHRFHRNLRLHQIGVRQRRRRSKPVDYKLESTRARALAARVIGGTIARGLAAREANACSSALNLSNAPNQLPSGLLQQASGGEYHETCFCTCCSLGTWWCCTVYRGRVCDALHHSRPGLAGFQHRAGGLRLQRMGPLLAPADLQ